MGEVNEQNTDTRASKESQDKSLEAEQKGVQQSPMMVAASHKLDLKSPMK